MTLHSKLLECLDKGRNLPTGNAILHTAPHHDDILLGYHPLLKRLMKSNRNAFAYVTSGFNSVTDNTIIETIKRIDERQLEDLTSLIFAGDYRSLLQLFIESSNRNDSKMMVFWESVILHRKCKEIFRLASPSDLIKMREWLIHSYFPHKQGMDIPEIQELKGSMRESESDRKLLMLKADPSLVFHMRSKFYTQNELSQEMIDPFIEILNRFKPQLVMVALDPKGVGPKTHYKALQLIMAGLKAWRREVKVWGYRNVWSRFQLPEASIIIPVADEEFKEMNRVFLHCYSTQVKAAFPAPDFDGPFSALAEKIQREQYRELKALLKEDLGRDVSGIICLKEVDWVDW